MPKLGKQERVYKEDKVNEELMHFKDLMEAFNLQEEELYALKDFQRSLEWGLLRKQVQEDLDSWTNRMMDAGTNQELWEAKGAVKALRGVFRNFDTLAQRIEAVEEEKYETG